MELRNELKGGRNRLLFFRTQIKKFFIFFQKGIDKLPELWYNRYRKREGKADPNKNEREIKNYDKDHLQSIPFERYKLD